MKFIPRNLRTKLNRIALNSPLRNTYLKKRYELEKNKTVLVEHYDIWRNAVRLSVYLPSGISNLSFLDGQGNQIEPQDVASCKTSIGKRTFFWLRFPDEGAVISVSHLGVPCKLRGHIGGGKLGKLSVKRCKVGQYSSASTLSKLPIEVRVLRKTMKSSHETAEHENCWIFADRIDKADDNAEHLYRHIMRAKHPHDIRFVLSKESPDWSRLEADGFNLIDFESVEHLKALAAARFVISSQATPTIRYPIPRKHIDTLCRADFIFLQHGIINTDCSRWINQHTYRMFISSTKREYSDLVAEDGPYNLSPDNVYLTGMPRFDGLFSQRNRFEKSLIAVMPTWRAYLATKKTPPASGFQASTDIYDSEYYKNWMAFLESSELKALCHTHGKRVVFVPHPIFRSAFSEGHLSDHIEIPTRSFSYQDIILRSCMCVTDYSSVANDMAAINVPIIHFAFPEKEMIEGRHTSTVDLEDWRQNSMGPVVTDLKSLLKEMSALFEGNQHSTVYSDRRAKEFSLCDGNACHRIYEIIRDIEAGRR